MRVFAFYDIIPRMLPTRDQEQSLTDETCDALIEIDMLGRLTFVHYMKKEIADLVGYTEEELIGQPVTDFLVDSDTMAGVEYFAKLYASERPFRAIGRKMKTKSGKVLSIESYMVPIYDSNGKFVGHRGMEFLIR